MASLERVRVLTSPLTGEVMLVVGRVKAGGVLVASSKRAATEEAVVAVAEHLLHGMPDGASVEAEVTVRGRRHLIRIMPVEEGGSDGE